MCKYQFKKEESTQDIKETFFIKVRGNILKYESTNVTKKRTGRLFKRGEQDRGAGVGGVVGDSWDLVFGWHCFLPPAATDAGLQH